MDEDGCADRAPDTDPAADTGPPADTSDPTTDPDPADTGEPSDTDTAVGIPSLTILTPTSASRVLQGAMTTFEATVADPEDPPEALTVVVRSDVDGELCRPQPASDGAASCIGTLSTLGVHRVTFIVSDLDADAASDFVLIEVVDGDGFDDDGDGFTELQGDCDDSPTGAQTHPGSPELPNSADDDCDGTIDEGTIRFDDDGDGYCEGPACSDGSLPGDCDDTTRTRSPGEDEVPADGTDQDCDGEEACWFDGDNDGYGTDFTQPSTDLTCGPTNSTDNIAPRTDDCDDTNAQIYPGAPFPPGGVQGQDYACNGLVTCYQDLDGDGFGSDILADSGDPTCSSPGVSPNNDDCNDDPTTGFAIHPDAVEIPANGIDEDCDQWESCYRDEDGDGHGSGVLVEDPMPSDCTGPGVADTPDDCYDGNDDAYPGQPGWFDVERGDGSFDYDCTGTAEARDAGQFQCGCTVQGGSAEFPIESFTAGWEEEPACGQPGLWVSGCLQTLTDPSITDPFAALIFGAAECLIGIDPLDIATSVPRIQQCR